MTKCHVRNGAGESGESREPYYKYIIVIHKTLTIKYNSICRRDGIGIRARLRGVWGNPCGFKSRRRHHEKDDDICYRLFYL